MKALSEFFEKIGERYRKSRQSRYPSSSSETRLDMALALALAATRVFAGYNPEQLKMELVECATVCATWYEHLIQQERAK